MTEALQDTHPLASDIDIWQLRRASILRAFASQLRELTFTRTPDPEIVEEIMRQADAALGDCLESIQRGAVRIDYDTIARLPLRMNKDEDAECGVLHTAEVYRVSDLLFHTAADSVGEFLDGDPEAVGKAVLWFRAMHESLSIRTSALLYGYDAAVRPRLDEMLAEDRRRLARDIHDWIGSGISVAHRNLDLYEIYNQRNLPGADERLGIARKALDQLMDNTRRIVTDLRTTWQSVGSVRDELQWFMRCLSSQATVDIVVSGDEGLVPPEQRQELYVIIRECLRNIDQHSRARAAAVVVTIAADAVSVMIADDGVGFDQARLVDGRVNGKQHGLASMRERAEQFGGTVRIDSRPGRGTRIQVELPLSAPPAGGSTAGAA
jgi:signal transduction histidine kinase